MAYNWHIIEFWRIIQKDGLIMSQPLLDVMGWSTGPQAHIPHPATIPNPPVYCPCNRLERKFVGQVVRNSSGVAKRHYWQLAKQYFLLAGHKGCGSSGQAHKWSESWQILTNQEEKLFNNIQYRWSYNYKNYKNKYNFPSFAEHQSMNVM